MREILYKGKIIENKQWVFGGCAKIDYRVFIIEDDIIDEDAELALFIRVIPESICEYTGLTDDNGNKIFEGDILHLFWSGRLEEYNWKAVVVYGNPNCETNWGWQLKDITKCDYNTDILLWVNTEQKDIHCEVIGNIHDNPEILRGE